MPPQQNPPLKLVKPQPAPVIDASSALGELQRALKATSFYPKDHPVRTQTLTQAHSSLVQFMNGKNIVLVIGRKGFTDADGGLKVESNPLTISLSREIFIRRMRRLTFLPDLTLDDLRAFLFLLTISPEKIASSGGIERLMTDHGFRTIWANEIDLSVIREKRQALESSGEGFIDAEDNKGLFEETVTTAETGAATDFEMPEEDLSLEQLISRMELEHDETRYLELAKKLSRKTEEYKHAGRIAELVPVLSFLLRQGEDETKDRFIAEYAMFTFEQVASGEITDYILQNIQNREYQDKEQLFHFLRHLGKNVVYAILQQLCTAEDLYARKALAISLIRIGEPAIPPIVSMLKDERWYVIRNMVAILGELGSKSSVPGLRRTASHPDERVRKETIRALSRIKGREAESVIISLIYDKSQVIRKQAIQALGTMKSQTAVEQLLQIATQSDFFMKHIPLKKEALVAVGRIGDRQAVPELIRIMQTPSWQFWRCPEDLKIAAVASLGMIGDEAAIAPLLAMSTIGGKLGRACSEAIETIERLA